MSYTDAFFDRNKDKIHVVERLDGNRVFSEYPVKYVFYYPDTRGKYRSIFNEPLTKVVCTNKKDFNKEKRMHSGKKLYESDINPLFRFLEETFSGKDAPSLNLGFFDLEVDFNKQLGFAPPDDPFNPITAIALHLSHLNKTICLAVKPNTLTAEQATEIMNRFPDSYLMEDEKELLLTFLELIEDVDVLSGWNSTGFDIPYTVNRITRILGKEYNRTLCFWDQYPSRREYEMYGKMNETYDLVGRQHLDYLELYRKYTYHEMHSYSLDAIGEYELDEKKVAYEGTLHQLYNDDFETFIDYNRQDVDLLVKLDKKLQFIDLANVIAHDNCVILPTTMGSVAQIDQAIVNEAHQRGMIVPDRIRKNDNRFNKVEIKIDEHGFDYDDRTVYGDSDDDEKKTKIKENESVAGAYVAVPKTGIHEWVGSIDLNSLYPSILRALNMSPETLVGQIRLDLTSEMLSNFDKVSEAWDGKFATREYELVVARDKETLLNLDFEDGNTIQATGAELYNLVFNDNMPWMLTSNGTLFTTEKRGIIPGLLERWYSERKDLQKKAKSFKDNDQEKFTFWDKRQLVKKILLNSLYGALLNVGSRFFDARLGQSTTLTGRCIVRHMSAQVNEFIAEKYDHNGDAVIYGDTDSVAFDSIISICNNTYKKDITIEDLFYKGDICWKEGDKEYSRNDDIKVINYDNGNLKYNNYNYVYRHKVSKRKFKITDINGKSVTVTEDHSIMVLEDDNLVEKKPVDLKNGDKIICLK